MSQSPAVTAHHDQLQAATRDATRRFHHLADTLRTRPYESDDPWLTTTVAAYIDRLNTRPVATCPHLTGSAQVAYGVLWRPNELTCGHCTRSLRALLDDDHRCDRCGAFSLLITPMATQHGPILLAFGLCRSCYRTTTVRNVAQP